MTQIQPFTFPTTGQPVRTLPVDGEPWFVASDLAAILGYRDAFNALRLLDEDEKGTHLVSTPGGEQLASIVSEAGLYALTLRSTLENAKPFRRWVTHEVIPAIRKTGSYSLPREYSRLELIDMARESELARIDAENRAALAECRMHDMEPAARMADELMVAEGDYSVREAAQILSRDRNIKTGQGRLFRYLREIGWIDAHNQPYQRQIDLGRVVVRARTYDHPSRDEQVATQQVRITGKGIGELHRLLAGQSQLPALVSEGVAA